MTHNTSQSADEQIVPVTVTAYCEMSVKELREEIKSQTELTS